MPYKDKEKHNAWLKAYHEANKAAYIKIKESTPCTDCSKYYPHYIMEWDHVQGEKKFNIAELAVRGPTSSQLLEELAKCELVYANCHATRTFLRRTR
jgi:hypothetical protein